MALLRPGAGRSAARTSALSSDRRALPFAEDIFCPPRRFCRFKKACTEAVGLLFTRGAMPRLLSICKCRVARACEC